jgi:dolichol kinase
MGELRRRTIHATGSLIPGGYLLDGYLGLGVVDWWTIRYVVLAGSGVALVLEALRLTGRVEWRLFDRLTREYEQENLAGYALYAFGMTAAAWAFEPAVGLPSMLMLAIGDPISGLLGSGGLSKRRSVLAVMFLVCLAIGSPFVSLPVAAAGALVATIADGLKPIVAGYVIDDNLTIPTGAGAAMAVAHGLLG